jgi:hypothetical protein
MITMRFLPKPISAFAAVTSLLLLAWIQVPVDQDPVVAMPGSQPRSVLLEAPTNCENCHGGYNRAVEPAHNWRGSMMSQAARDPLWFAATTVALQDSIWALGNSNAGDICIRCHSPIGWLGGRSDPTNMTLLSGADLEGVSCDACHRMVDPMNALRQPGVAAETASSSILASDRTYAADLTVLSALRLFDGTFFLNALSRLPTYFGSGLLPDYIDAAGGQYIMDPAGPKRGPRSDAMAMHPIYYSRYHKSRTLCGTCHDVSNPVLANLSLPGTADRQAAASYFHVERTFSEFRLSAYGADGGAPANAAIGLGVVNKCQDCHMADTRGASTFMSAVRSDLAFHDQTGGNTWISKILASADRSGPAHDAYNYAILSGSKYSGAKIDVTGLQGRGQALFDGSARARQQLQIAATLLPLAQTANSISLRVQNNTGHKLLSGYPEGRRMWLNVVFYDATGTVIGEINPYTPLVIARDAGGNAQYVSGGDLEVTDERLIWHVRMSSAMTGERDSKHFVLSTDRLTDNRIPPKGFDRAKAAERLALPRWEEEDAPDYFTAEEYAGGWDDVSFEKPAGTSRWVARLFYQTTSLEYVSFLRDEINGAATSLSSPTPAGAAQAYIIQSDPWFATLKGWGDAIWDLWLHNGGSPPELMTSTEQMVPTGRKRRSSRSLGD